MPDIIDSNQKIQRQLEMYQNTFSKRSEQDQYLSQRMINQSTSIRTLSNPESLTQQDDRVKNLLQQAKNQKLTKLDFIDDKDGTESFIDSSENDSENNRGDSFAYDN